jgi:hypothetical protein
MPLDAVGSIELGPLPADGYDWYRIRAGFLYDLTDDGAGWVAFGPSSTPWLALADDVPGYFPFRGTAGTGPDVVGAVEIGDGHGVRWAAVGEDCPLVVSIDDVAIVSERVDGFAEGEVFLFRDYPELVGMFDIEVDTKCSWTLSHGTYQG